MLRLLRHPPPACCCCCWLLPAAGLPPARTHHACRCHHFTAASLPTCLPTVQILYSDSLRQACTPKSADPYFLAFTIFVLVAFCLEAAASCLANPHYAKRWGGSGRMAGVCWAVSVLCV